MINSSFTKLHQRILNSSIWLRDESTRLVWITMLALCDRDGIVRASPLGLAHTARVSNEACMKALEILEAPDADSRTPDFEGRRIQRVSGGFAVLNYPRYLHETIQRDRREYFREKKRESRARQKAGGGTIRPEHVENGGSI